MGAAGVGVGVGVEVGGFRGSSRQRGNEILLLYVAYCSGQVGTQRREHLKTSGPLYQHLDQPDNLYCQPGIGTGIHSNAKGVGVMRIWSVDHINRDLP